MNSYEEAKKAAIESKSPEPDLVRGIVPFEKCLANWAAPERIDNFKAGIISSCKWVSADIIYLYFTTPGSKRHNFLMSNSIEPIRIWLSIQHENAELQEKWHTCDHTLQLIPSIKRLLKPYEIN